MTLQSPSDLGLSGLGVDGEVQPRESLPSLVDGIHLRWGFGLDRGFPDYGYYLYRREHIGPSVNPLSVTAPGPIGTSVTEGERINAGDWTVTVAKSTAVTNRDEYTQDADGSIDSSPNGRPEFDISTVEDDTDTTGLTTTGGSLSGSSGGGTAGGGSGGSSIGPSLGGGFGTVDPIEPEFPDPGSLKLSFPEPAFRVDLTVAPRYPGGAAVTMPVMWRLQMNATAYAGEVPLDRASGLPQGTVSLSGDAITEVEITGLGSVLDVLIYPVSAKLDEGWEPVPNAPTPITLPVSHPNYPADSAKEDVDAARQTIKDRIQYRDPDRYAGPSPSSQPGGTVTTTHGSPIVHGTDTDWSPSAAGSVFRIAGDDSTYAILQVLDAERLVLSRPHDGTNAGVNYDLVDDDFGRLYDAMIECVASEDDEVDAAGLALPAPVHDHGSVTLTPDSKTVSGSGVRWDDDVAGLTLQVGMDLSGSITLQDGSRTVEGHGTAWTEDIEGRLIRIPDVRYSNRRADPSSLGYQASTYRIKSVENDTELTLNRPYVGRVPKLPPNVGTGRLPEPAAVSYTVFRPERYTIAAVDTVTNELTLAEPYRGDEPLADRAHVLTASVESESPRTVEEIDSPVDRPTMPLQYPIDQLLMGSIDPALAQSLGLYWIDEDATPGTAYDYMVVAAHGAHPSEVGNGDGGDDTSVTHGDLLPSTSGSTSGTSANGSDDVSLQAVLNLAARGDGPLGEPGIDAFVTFDEQRNRASTLDAPPQPETYRLPGATVPTPDGGTIDRQSNVGLRWEHGSSSGPLGPDEPVAYYLWRHDFSGTPGQTPSASQYNPVTRDGAGGSSGGGGIGGGGIGGGIGGSGIGGGLGGVFGEGFGTTGSMPESMEGDPLAGAEPIVPGPTSEAATRPEDWPPFPLTAIDSSVADGWYSYRLSGVDLFGRHSDLGEPGAWYDWDPVTRRSGSPPESVAIEIDDDLPPPPPTGVEAAIRDPAEPDVTTDSGDPELVVQWVWTAQHAEQAPDLSAFELHFEPGQFNTTAGEITSRSAAGSGRSRVETTVAGGADAGAYVGAFLRADGHSYAIVDSGGDPLWLVVEHVSHSTDGDDLPPPADGDCAIAVPGAYTAGTAEVVDGSTVVSGTNTDWNKTLVGETFRTANDTRGYEIERVEDATTLHLAESYDRPADNEGRGPAADTLAYRISHPVGTDAGDPDAWTDTPTPWANAHGTVQPSQRSGSASSYPWTFEVRVPAPATGAGKALDPSPDEPVVHGQIGVSSVDSAGTIGRVSAPSSVVRRQFDSPDEPGIPTADSERVLASDPDYHGTSYYTFRWQRPTKSGVSSHVYRAMDRSLFRVDWKRRSGGETLNRSEPRFPPNLSSARKDEVVTEITNHWGNRASEFETAVSNYRDLSNDALRVLASLPENDDAFTQLTTEPIGAGESKDRQTRDTADSYTPDPSTLHAYVDELDGRASNVYVYRARTIDAGANRSDTLSIASPVVALPDLQPPGTPSPASIAGGDREITVRWRSVYEDDLHAYRVYRTDDPDATRDLRLMTEMATVSVSNPPDQRPTVVEWTDTDVTAGETYRYRIAAVDNAGNQSDGSTTIGGAAYAASPPNPPTWDRSTWVRVDANGTTQPWSPSGVGTPAIDLEWSIDNRTAAVLVQRAADPTAMWQTVAAWDDHTETLDTDVRPADGYRYRLKVRDSAGNMATGPVETVSPPGGN